MIDTDRLITDGDTSCAIVYRLTDRNGRLWRSAPATYTAAIRADGVDGASLNASGQWIRIPQLRHLLPGTTAQIEIYFGTVDLQSFRVIENDPTLPYVDICPQAYHAIASVMPSLTEAITRSGTPATRETLYTTGNALANDPPPRAKAVAIWNNRAIAVSGKEVWPSQEFATGLGIQWSTYLKMLWEEGTGSILAVGKVNADYCAVFKQDRIGIISGQGPDGRGSGNYIVRPLSTKSGTVNPRSLLAANDGCYFQDSQSLQLMVVTPQLAVEECAKGWKNATSATVTASLHFEASRQVWFATSDLTIVVLDYGHRTDDSPFGQTYIWDISGFGLQVVGMEIVGGSPILLFSDGSMATYSESTSVDTLADGTNVAILMKIRTGALAPFGVGGMLDVAELQMIGERLSPHLLKLTTFPDGATTGTTRQIELSTGIEKVGTRPPNCQRINRIEVEIEEALSTIPSYGKGFEFVGFSMMVQNRGKTQTPNYGRMI